MNDLFPGSVRLLRKERKIPTMPVQVTNRIRDIGTEFQPDPVTGRLPFIRGRPLGQVSTVRFLKY